VAPTEIDPAVAAPDEIPTNPLCPALQTLVVVEKIGGDPAVDKVLGTVKENPELLVNALSAAFNLFVVTSTMALATVAAVLRDL
jgi:hypothetical protein